MASLTIKTLLRVSAGLLFIAAGTLHFLRTPTFEKIVPPYLPSHRSLVYLSGAAEIAGGLGLLTTRWQRSASRGLAVLLVMVFPANLYMATNSVQVTAKPVPQALLWLRLPLQLVLVWWVLAAGGPAARQNKAAGK